MGEALNLAILLTLKDTASAGLKSAEANLGGFGKALGIIGGVGLAAAGAGIAAVKQFADAGSVIHDLAQKTGFSAEMLSELKFAADQSGGSIGTIEGAVKRMAMALGEAKTPGSALIATFQDLGLDLKTLQAMNPEDQFMAIAKGIADIQDPTQKAAAAITIFGRQGTDLLPMLADGSAGLATFAQQAKDLGIVFTTETAASADSMGDALGRLKASFSGVTNIIGAALVPALEPLVDSFTDLVKSLPIKEIGELLKTLLPPLIGLFMQLLKALPVDALLKLVEAALKPLLDLFTRLLKVFPTDLFVQLIETLVPLVNVLMKIIALIPIEPFMKLMKAVLIPLIPIIGAVTDILDGLLPVLKPIFDFLTLILNIITPIIEGVGKVVGFMAGGVGKVLGGVLGGIGKLFGGAEGGIVTQPTFGMIGEAGPEAVVPLSSAGGARPLAAGMAGGGNTYVTVNVAGSVTSERDLTQTIRRLLIRTSDRNGNVLLPGVV